MTWLQVSLIITTYGAKSYFLTGLSLIHMFPGYHKNLAFYTTSLDDNFLISLHLLVCFTSPNTFARNCEENYWMFTENTEDVNFRRNHSPATMYDNSNKIIKFFMVYCIIRLGKKNMQYIAFVEYIWLNTLSLELQRNNKQNKTNYS